MFCGNPMKSVFHIKKSQQYYVQYNTRNYSYDVICSNSQSQWNPNVIAANAIINFRKRFNEISFIRRKLKQLLEHFFSLIYDFREWPLYIKKKPIILSLPLCVVYIIYSYWNNITFLISHKYKKQFLLRKFSISFKLLIVLHNSKCRLAYPTSLVIGI